MRACCHAMLLTPARFQIVLVHRLSFVLRLSRCAPTIFNIFNLVFINQIH